MVVTRRSRSDLTGDDESTADLREREPLLEPISEQLRRPPPPPPPPPPMPTALTGNSQRPAVEMRTEHTANAQIVEASANTTKPYQQQQIQYLQVRVVKAIYRPSKIYRRHHYSQPSHDTMQLHSRNKTNESDTSTICKQEIVRVLIPPEGFASERQLSECLNHACNDYDDRNQSSVRNLGDDASWDSTEEYFEDRGRANVAGMFRESDGVFVPLSVIYSQPSAFVDDILSIKRPTPPEETRQNNKPTKKNSIFLTFIEIFGIAAVTMASWLTYSASQSFNWNLVTIKMESVFLAMVNLPFYLFDVMIEFPLRELYRHGPSLVGWEGETLARICSRVTHYGDEDFWRRNMEECEEIYASKEAAAMQIRKPILIGVIILVLFYMIKSIVEAQAMRRQQLDPNMVETYRAITMLTRQLKRAVNCNA